MCCGFEDGSDSGDLPTDVCDACLDQHYSCCHACGDYTNDLVWTADDVVKCGGCIAA
jgi:hypothetical protein